MTDNIIKFPKEPIQRISFDRIPVNKTLLNADEMDLEDVVVLGWKDGEIRVLSSDSKVSECLFLMECAKTMLINGAVNGQEFLVEDPESTK
jgi:hypothetical protein